MRYPYDDCAVKRSSGFVGLIADGVIVLRQSETRTVRGRSLDLKLQQKEGRRMATNLYVGNLSFNTTEGEILDLFGKVGTVARCQLILDKYTNRSRGFAFVEMGSQEDADKAIKEINGKEVDGRALVVNEARPREDRPRRNFGEGGGGRGNRR